MKQLNNLQLEVIWTNRIKKEEILCYVNNQERVFKGVYSVEKFQKKFLENIYGESLIILTYIDNECVGSMVFWRNDIEGAKAYQPCEMAVLNDFRGLGIFSKMNDEGLKYIEENTLFYNFPNDNSLPYYKKIGWNIHSKKRYKLFNPIVDGKEIIKIDKKYLEWLLNGTKINSVDLLKYIQINKKNYLLKKRFKNMYLIIGEIPYESTAYIKKAKLPILLHYSSKGYLGRGIITVTKHQNEEVIIPLYKIGPLF